jgi:hypothetical protein
VPAGILVDGGGLGPSSITFNGLVFPRAGLNRLARASRQLIYSADYALMNELVGYLTDNCCAADGARCDAACAPAAATRPAKRRRAA